MDTPFLLGSSRMDPDSLVALSSSPSPVLQVRSESWEHIQAQRTFLENALSEQKTIYGVNTGFGFLSNVVIDKKNITELQRNIIRSHACGVGEPLAPELARALLILKAHNFLLGSSGVSRRCVESFLQAIEHDILPYIPSQGSVGASGDLAPLSHLALSLIGEGKSYYKGECLSTTEILSSLGLRPFSPNMKEGLAIINGTQYMSVEGSFAYVEAQRLIETADIALALSLTGFKGTRTAFDSRIHELRQHKGQLESSRNIFSLLEKHGEEFYTKVQDPYSFRCASQVHGVSRMTHDFLRGILETELNSTTDNPVVCENGEVLSGGNFHGAPLAAAFDFMSIALTDLSSISERRTEKLTNPHMSELSAFLVKEEGLNSGFMIPHVVVASLVSENKVLSHPSSVDSIPTSADKEDHVSMGAYGAQKLRKITRNLASVLAIELLAASQAIDLEKTSRVPPKLHPYYEKVRAVSPMLQKDRSLHEDVEKLSSLLLDGSFLNV